MVGKGSGVFWLQQAQDDDWLNRIAQQLFRFVGKSVSDDIVSRYCDFKKPLQKVQDGKASDAARQAIESLIQLMKNPAVDEEPVYSRTVLAASSS